MLETIFTKNCMDSIFKTYLFQCNYIIYNSTNDTVDIIMQKLEGKKLANYKGVGMIGSTNRSLNFRITFPSYPSSRRPRYSKTNTIYNKERIGHIYSYLTFQANTHNLGHS